MRDWERAWRRCRLRPKARGRPARRSPPEKRSEVFAAVKEEGVHVGVATYRKSFPEMSRRELEDLVRRSKRVQRRRARRREQRLEWSGAGAVWAIDHTGPSKRKPGPPRPVIAVRDLGADRQLAWEMLPDATAKTAGEVLEELFAVHGPPLVLKSDNGPAFRAADTGRMLRRHGVHHLRSPARRPRYNGACEAGIRWMKERTKHFGAVFGPWSPAALEAARRQANARLDANVEAADACAAQRRAFAATVRRCRTKAAQALGVDATKILDRRVQLKLDRGALQAALEEHGILSVQRRRIPQPI